MATTLEIAFERVRELVRTFESNKHAYLGPDYPEAQARKDFIDKLFIALGWDVNHDIQKNPYEQEVKVEPPVTVGATQRHADYAFHLAPNFNNVRFFVEAKKPSAAIATKENYFQVIRYGWNSQTPLAVLTDFQQFKVLDCRYKPDPDTALSRIVYTHDYTEYADPEKFARIYWLFSREAVASGSLEKRVAELHKPRGKAVQRGLFPGAYKPVDESFLEELDEFRKDLARSFKASDPHLDSETLTELAQRTLDRLVFLRFLEDKGIEIQPIVDKFGDRGTEWEDFVAASRRLDGIYNGVVFKYHSILDASTFRVDGAVFGGICERLASFNTPYDFNYIPIPILGSIYERFLGKVIVATAKRVHVVEKPEVRKAGGVYYTPEYISRYIVQNTVGKLITGRTPSGIATMRFADIACGSGSFLLCIYDVLLQYHGNFYNALTGPEKARAVKRGDCIDHDGKLYLSLSKKREILLNNIYGVDIDAQATEVTQFSLFLRLLQDETTVSTHQYLLDFEHVAQLKKLLPDLSKNIVCGNSLIGTDILDGQLFPRSEERKLNPMNFEDAFPEVMKRGGFDAIVGNPPYLKERGNKEFFEPIMHSDYRKYHQGKMDLWYYFLHRAIDITKNGGRIGLITNSYWVKSDGASKLIERIKNNITFERVVDFGDFKIFDGVSGKHMVHIYVNGAEVKNPICDYIKIDPSSFEGIIDNFASTKIKLESIFIDGKVSFDKDENLRLENCTTLEDLFDSSIGVQESTDKISTKQLAQFKKSGFSAGTGVFVLSSQELKQLDLTELEQKLFKKYLDLNAVGRFSITFDGEYLLYSDETVREDIATNRYPQLKRHLDRFRDFITSSNRPYGLHRPRETRFFDSPKLICKGMFEVPEFCYDEEKYYVGFSFSVIIRKSPNYNLKYLLGLLNSSLGKYWFYKNGKRRGVGVDIGVKVFRRFPIRTIDFDNNADKSRHDEVVAKVEAMLDSKKQLAKSHTDKDKTYYVNKCASLDRKIDLIVYDLYGLTEDEIRIVEESDE